MPAVCVCVGGGGGREGGGAHAHNQYDETLSRCLGLKRLSHRSGYILLLLVVKLIMVGDAKICTCVHAFGCGGGVGGRGEGGGGRRS